MADSFADLWNSSSNSNSNSNPNANRSLSSQVENSRTSSPANSSTLSPGNNNGRRYDSFAVLANAGSAPTSRPITPQIQPAKLNPNSKGMSAFDDLTSFAGTSTSKPLSKPAAGLGVTLASRPVASDSFWNQFGATNTSAEPSVPALARPGLDFAPAPRSASASAMASSTTGDGWDFDLLAAPSTTSGSPLAQISSSPDPFEFELISSNQASPPTATFKVQDHDHDDLLGDLAKPVSQIVAERSTPSPSPRRVPSPSPLPPSTSPQPPAYVPRKAVTPPPHVIGRIVEMGFTPEQARVALAATETGEDVDAAMEILLAFPEEDEGEGEEQRQQPPPQRSQRGASPNPASGLTLQDTTSELLTQASNIGRGMFAKANSLWKEGREKALKAYEAQAQSPGPAASSSTSGSGRREDLRQKPKWEDEEVEFPTLRGPKKNSGISEGFRDHGDDMAFAQPAPRRPSQPPPSKSTTARSPLVQPQDSPVLTQPKTQRGFYQSPNRRSTKTPTTSSTPPPGRVRTPIPASIPTPLPPKPHPASTVTATPAQLSAASSNKSRGNELFKLGQFADAAAAFSEGLDVLPSGHVLVIPLFTNRALARMRIGDAKGCVEDAGSALAVVGDEVNAGLSIKVLGGEGDVRLDEAFVKALKRRAEGYEMMERWSAARVDWEKLAGCTFVGTKVRGEAAGCAGRCRRMLEPPAPSTSTSDAPKSNPKSRTKPKSPADELRALHEAPSETVTRLRSANSSLEAEDSQKYALKDSVDAKLQAWSGNKENNLRALLAGMDLVLWDELNWKKVGMHELVSEKQVKIVYTKAIAKVHPDKLSNLKTSLENRMVANGVFATLNQAWVNHKP